MKGARHTEFSGSMGSLCGGDDAPRPSHHQPPGLEVEEEWSLGDGALPGLFYGQMNKGFVLTELSGTF